MQPRPCMNALSLRAARPPFASKSLKKRIRLRFVTRFSTCIIFTCVGINYIFNVVTIKTKLFLSFVFQLKQFRRTFLHVALGQLQMPL